VLGVAAPSPKNAISSGLRSQTSEGNPAIMPAQGTKCFDLTSIRHACILNLQVGFAGVGVSCTIQFAARRYGSDVTKVRELLYNAGNTFLNPFNTTTFSKADFGCVSRVDVTLLSANVIDSNTVVGIHFDDFKYTAYTK